MLDELGSGEISRRFVATDPCSLKFIWFTRRRIDEGQAVAALQFASGLIIQGSVKRMDGGLIRFNHRLNHTDSSRFRFSQRS